MERAQEGASDNASNTGSSSAVMKQLWSCADAYHKQS